MNGIDRRGQKVVCKESFTVYLDFGGLILPGALPGRIPQCGEVYTVSDFIPTGIVVGQEPHAPGIALSEIVTPTCDCCGNPMGWPINAFRPLDERQTDISSLVEAGKRTDLLDPIDLPFTEPVS